MPAANSSQDYLLGVVIPCYKVKKHIIPLLAKITGPCKIFIVDDACPQETGRYVQENVTDDRIKIIYHQQNQGVGGAVITGYREAVKDGCDVIVKMDGDGQMDPAFLSVLVKPIINGEADYVKGNRFFNIEELHRMPVKRLFGNGILSFISKMSTGYWNIFDPTNGYTAIHRLVLQQLPLDKISKRYFFESDFLFRLGTIRAKVMDLPMPAIYQDEESSLSIKKILGEFIVKHITNTFKRVFYNYFLRDFSLASVMLVFSLFLIAFGTIFGGGHWLASMHSGVPATSGTVMIAGLSVIVGFIFFISFINYDIASVPKSPIHPFLFEKTTAEDRGISIEQDQSLGPHAG
ncbi:MAG: glycosyltransferase family 2 protein [Desulfarculaceae bacterium]|nr:glycosyltransferase family 2 protein [Desulfarculaceae bacterium]